MPRSEAFHSGVRPRASHPRSQPPTTGRLVANVVTVFAGVAMFAMAAWTGSVLGPVETGEDRFSTIPWLVHGLAGLLAIGGVIVAQRWPARALGRAMLILAGLMLWGGLIAFRTAGPWGIFGFALPGLLLLACAPFLGPMPPPRPDPDALTARDREPWPRRAGADEP